MNGTVDAHDIDQLAEAIRVGSLDLRFDRDDSGKVDANDLKCLIRSDLNTWFGDANLDGEFNTTDLVQVLSAGKYETQQTVGWSEGDWNGDGVFGTGDLVIALEGGGYERDPKQNLAPIPEPTSILLLVIGLIGSTACRRRPQN
jgi:hypothetical protein